MSSFVFTFKNFVQALCGLPLRIAVLIIADFLWAFLVPLAALAVYRFFFPFCFPSKVFAGAAILAAMIVIVNALTKCYHGSVWNPGAAINRIEEIRRLSLGVLGNYAGCCILLCITGNNSIYPLIPSLASLAVTITGFPMVRFIVRYLMKQTGIGQIRVFIAGAGKTAYLIGTELEASVYYGYRVLGYFDDDPAKKDVDFYGKKWLGRLCDAPRLSLKYNANYIICCLPPSAMMKAVRTYTKAFAHVLIIPSNEIFPITAIYPTMIGFISGFEFQNRLLFFIPRILKRILETIFSFICIILLFPVFCILALLVKLSSPGPVFYSAARLGLNGKKIKILKFRTMYQDAEQRLESLLEENPELKREWSQKFKIAKDPRVTRIGYILRKSSLDELPQFINVLRGEMSLIGPRPIVEKEIAYYGEAYDFFCRVRPGITGLWQVSGRSSVDYTQRVAMDLFYVMNWSIWLDWFILWKTVLAVIFCKGSC